MKLRRTVWNTFKGDGTETRGGETKILKRWGKLGQGLGALKRGAGIPLQIMISGAGFVSVSYLGIVTKFWF